jgi:hypothetical protein
VRRLPRGSGEANMMNTKAACAVLFATALLVVPALAATDMVNEDWVLKAKETHSFSFTVPVSTPVRVDLTPVSHADKGVTMRIVPAEDFDACRGAAQGQCRSRGEFDGFAVRSFSHVGTLPPGRWTFFVTNTENILERATVHVHLVFNPGN